MSPRLLLLLAALACTGDGDPDPTADADADGILDVHEGSEDPDGDGLPNHLDEDSDGDGLPDALEAGDADLATLPFDTDADGAPDFLDLDSDGNGLPDIDEAGAAPFRDTDDDGLLDAHDLDDDGDGAPDRTEMNASDDLDTDGDIVPDRLDTDSDDDGLSDAVEAGWTAPTGLRDTDEDGEPDLRDVDSDGDGYPDADEAQDPNDPADSDGDGLPDHLDMDSDDDGLTDLGERTESFTDPRDADTDDDGFRDGTEVQLGEDPRDASTALGGPLFHVDARVEREEALTLAVQPRRVDLAIVTARLEPDQDWYDRIEGLVLRSVFERVAAEFPDLGVSLSVPGGFPKWGYGRPDMDTTTPILMHSPVETDAEAVRDSIDSLPFIQRAGASSDLEALHQMLTGAGYDFDCDGQATSLGDVLPWRASPDDPFGGAGGERAPVDLRDRRPGVGLRPWSQVVALWVAAYPGTNPDLTVGPNVGLEPWGVGPGGCPFDTGHLQVVDDLTALDALFVGVSLRPEPVDEPDHFYTHWTLEQIATGSGSLADLDGDGERDDPLVLTAEMTSTEQAENAAEQIATAIRAAITDRTISEVSLVIEDDPDGMVVSVEPEALPMPAPDAPPEVTFRVTLRGTVPPTQTDHVVLTEMVLVGRGAQLDRRPVYLVVPGTGRDHG